MKKHSRPLALLLAFLTILSIAACKTTEIPEETTVSESESASTVAPETTEALTVAPPVETTADSTATDTDSNTATPPETSAPEKKDTLSVIMQTGVGEPILSGLADEKYAALLDAREKALLYEHNTGIELSRTDDLVTKIKNTVQTSENRFDLILTDPAVGGELIRSGLLEDLSGAGIEINSLSGTVGSITQSLALGKRTYLFASKALVSDITSAYGIRYNGAKLSSSPVDKALAGDFTLELMLTYISESSFALTDASPLELYQGVGGKIFISDSLGVPMSALRDSVAFSLAYAKTLKLTISATNDSKAVFKAEKLSPLASGEYWLPLPKANADAKYVTPLDASSLSLFAAPAGVVSGKRLARLADALAGLSSDYRAAVHSEINGKGGSAEALALITESTRLDLGSVLGWGNIDDLINDALKAQTAPDALLADRITVMRNEAVDAAAKIVAERLGIK